MLPKKRGQNVIVAGVLNVLSFQVSTTQIRITLFRETQNCVHEYSTTILALPMHETDFDQY